MDTATWATWGIPPEWVDDAEDIRAHLVHLRGGTVFLSPRDGALLLRWFEEGVSAGHVLAALERAVRARRKSRARTPLSLASARPHLAHVQLLAPETLGAEVRQLRERCESLWQDLGSDGQEGLRQAAMARLGDLLVGLEPAEIEALVCEEIQASVRNTLG